jgi:hypothetical protein
VIELIFHADPERIIQKSHPSIPFSETPLLRLMPLTQDLKLFVVCGAIYVWFLRYLICMIIPCKRRHTGAVADGWLTP